MMETIVQIQQQYHRLQVLHRLRRRAITRVGCTVPVLVANVQVMLVAHQILWEGRVAYIMVLVDVLNL
jgi:hypothetical protein